MSLDERDYTHNRSDADSSAFRTSEQKKQRQLDALKKRFAKFTENSENTVKHANKLNWNKIIISGLISAIISGVISGMHEIGYFQISFANKTIIKNELDRTIINFPISSKTKK